MARMLQASAALMPAAASFYQAQAIRSEMEDNISEVKIELMQLVNTMMEKMQAEVDRRADAMLRTLVQMLKDAPATENNKTVPTVETDTILGHRTRVPANRGKQQPMRAAQPSWAAVTSTGTQKTSNWTTVTSGKKKVKKHPLDQGRILLVRNVQNHTCDPGDIMFEVNKALAHAKARVTVRLIKMGYTEKGNLTGVIGENALAEDLFVHAQAVMAAVQKLDPEVVYMDKTEKWCKLRVHGGALDRYMTEGGLEQARREIDLMPGKQLPHAPR
jgi:gas vesicle protein